MFLLDLLARTLADVLLPEGTHVKHAPVKQGWWYRTYVPGDYGAGRARDGSARSQERVCVFKSRHHNTVLVHHLVLGGTV
jgi:hypothetical protein